MQRLKLFIISLLYLLCACEEEPQYSNTYCNFLFQASLFPSSALTLSVSGAGGDFCIVKAVKENGVFHLKCTPNQGSYNKTDLDLIMNTAIGNELLNYDAMGHKRGLVIGRTYEGILCAYDLQCPNCDFNSELVWGAKSYQLKCNKCQRVYNIYSNYSYIETGSKGRPLEQYKRVTYDRNQGILKVLNP